MCQSVILCLSVLALSTSSIAVAQSTNARCFAPFATLVGDPAFARYPTRVSKSQPVGPEVRNGIARTYRTAIRNEAAKGPNFAGHYTLIEIGCGAATTCVAIADATTGKVHFLSNLRSASSLMRDTGAFDLARLNYRVSSRLLIVAGEPSENENREGMSYYLWDGRKLRLVRYVSAKTLCKNLAN